MKKFFLSVICTLVMTCLFSQEIVKEHYTVSGGLLAAYNASKFKVTGAESLNTDYSFKSGWSAGGWLNFPVTNHFSIEPQLTYSSYGYEISSTDQLLLKNGKLKYISVPLLLKFHTGEKLAIIAGPQIDFFSSFEDDDNNAADADFKKNNFSLFGGLELFPHGRVALYGRYLFGLSNIDDRASGSSGIEYKNQVIQAGVKLKLFGKKVEADSDGDGVIDKNDKCPSEKGFERYNGCPIPDTDGDGINDEVDKCPSVKGTAKYDGCPIPDTDGDGINDEEDKCPDVAGPASNNGCPIQRDIPVEVSKMLSSSSQNVLFASNSARLTSTATRSLNQIANILKKYPDLKVEIGGHTDTMEKQPDDISEERASNVKVYLVNKGISDDRIKVTGYGSSMPVSDNNTVSGRSKNRRVEIKVTY